MLTKEAKFQKTLKLYNMVKDAGLTWGINDKNEMIKHKIMLYKIE